MSGKPTLYVCHGDDEGPRFHPCRRIQEAMREAGIDITDTHPKVLTDDAVKASDVVVTMGCGDACPFYPGKRYEDWKLDDPAGQGIEAVRSIRDDIERRVRDLIATLAD